MSVVAVAGSERGLPAPHLAAGLALAAAIAWLQPFDLIFAAATFGQPALRATLIVAMALVGAGFTRAIGLEVGAHGQAGSLRLAFGAAVLVAVFCAGIDVLGARVLHGDYMPVMTTEPLAERTFGYMMRAFNENIIYRLFLGSALAYAFSRRWRAADGRPAPGALWCGFALSQAVNVGANVTALAPVTAAALLHDALRYFAPGMVWSWLFMRRGFAANELASTSVHLMFQPLIGALL